MSWIQGYFRRMSFKIFFSLIVRIAATAGKFGFVLVAALYMRLDDLGRYGFIASLSIIMSGIFGLEIYQIIMRAVATGAARDGDKSLYGTFCIVAASVISVLTFAILILMKWNILTACLAAAVVACEHLGNEQFRTLAAEGRGGLALQSFSVRSGLWSLGLPLLAMLHFLPKHWSLDLVIGAWLFADLVSFLYTRALPKAYFSFSANVVDVAKWLWKLLPLCITWLVISMTWRYLESGGRFVAGLILPGHSAGHFTLLITLGAMTTTVIKGMVEPLLFVKLSVLENSEIRKRYFYALIALSISGALGATFLLMVYVFVTHFKLSPMEYITYGIILVYTIFLNVSQAPHFVLYSHKQDNLILRSSVVAGVISVAATFLGGICAGEAGIAAGLLVGSVGLVASKAAAVMYMSRRSELPSSEAALE